MGDIIESLKRHVPKEKTRIKIYKDIIGAMEDRDWDTQDECLGEDPACDKAMRELHPDWDCWPKDEE
jgi:hypothetical protein